MPQITLRKHDQKPGSDDLTLRVQDATFEYLLSTTARDVRVSAFFEADTAEVSTQYKQLYVNEACMSHYRVTQIIPGSRTRKPRLPGEMKEGEQLTILVSRS